MTELNQDIKNNLSELIVSIADYHLDGKPAILSTALYYSTEKFLIDQINKIETKFKNQETL